MVVERVGALAGAVRALEERHVHAHVLPRRDHRLALRQQLIDRREHVSEVGGVLPVLGAISADLRRLRRDAVRPGRDLPFTRCELVEAIVGHDHRDLGDVVQLRVEAPELAVHEREGEVGQLYPCLRGGVALPTGIEPVSQP